MAQDSKQVTLGYNIVAGGWVGAYNPPPLHPLPHTQTHSGAKMRVTTLFYMINTDQWVNSQTVGPTDRQTDKASYLTESRVCD